MTDTAKIFTTGGSQAVRLPRRYRFEGQQEVEIWREGQRIVLQPKRRQWSQAFLSLAGSAADFPIPDEPPPIERGPEFD